MFTPCTASCAALTPKWMRPTGHCICLAGLLQLAAAKVTSLKMAIGD